MDKDIDDLKYEELVALATEATTNLLDWFIVHESDISLGVEDYGQLRSAYQWFVGKPPRSVQVH